MAFQALNRLKFTNRLGQAEVTFIDRGALSDRTKILGCDITELKPDHLTFKNDTEPLRRIPIAASGLESAPEEDAVHQSSQRGRRNREAWKDNKRPSGQQAGLGPARNKAAKASRAHSEITCKPASGKWTRSAASRCCS